VYESLQPTVADNCGENTGELVRRMGIRRTCWETSGAKGEHVYSYGFAERAELESDEILSGGDGCEGNGGYGEAVFYSLGIRAAEDLLERSFHEAGRRDVVCHARRGTSIRK